LVILDEPTAALGVAQTAQVLQLVGRLRTAAWGDPDLHTTCRGLEVADGSSSYGSGANGGGVRRVDRHREASSLAITGAERPRGRGHERDRGRRRVAPARRPRGAGASSSGPSWLVRVLVVLAAIWNVFAIANDRFLTSTNSSTVAADRAVGASRSRGARLAARRDDLSSAP